MENLKNLEQLKSIVDSLEDQHHEILFHRMVFRAELEDRLVKGLTGDEATKHFNSYMLLYGMDNMVIEI